MQRLAWNSVWPGRRTPSHLLWPLGVFCRLPQSPSADSWQCPSGHRRALANPALTEALKSRRTHSPIATSQAHSRSSPTTPFSTATVSRRRSRESRLKGGPGRQDGRPPPPPAACSFLGGSEGLAGCHTLPTRGQCSNAGSQPSEGPRPWEQVPQGRRPSPARHSGVFTPQGSPSQVSFSAAGVPRKRTRKHSGPTARSCRCCRGSPVLRQ